MTTLTAVTLVFNGLLLVIALGTLLFLTVLMQDKPAKTGLFAFFVFAIIFWSLGSFLARSTGQVASDENITDIGVRAIEVGFGATSISAFLLAATMTGVRSLFVWAAAWLGLFAAIGYRLVLLALDVRLDFAINADGLPQYTFPTINRWIYFGMAAGTVSIAIRNNAKFARAYISMAFLALGLALMLGVLSPRLRGLGIPELLSSFATVLIIYGMVQTEVLDPFLRRTRQVEIVQDVGVAVTNLRVDKVMETIAERAAFLLDARGGAVYLNEDRTLVLAAVHSLPEQHVGNILIPMGQGIVGEIAAQKRGIFVNHYWREMHGKPHEGFPIEAVGAVAGVPLMLGNDVVGVLIVIEERDGHLFTLEHVIRLQLIAPQAAVTIRNNRLLEHERDLKQRLLVQQTQLQSVLTSTSNPVLAIRRDFGIIFANQAAIDLLDARHLSHRITEHNLLEFIAPSLLPANPREFLQSIRHHGAYINEFTLEKTDYLCHIAPVYTQTRGWVIVLNDVTSLKEVDRLKSQMIRMTSHDLKNPLFSLMTYIELIEEDIEAHFDEVSRRNMEMVWIQIDRMERLINGILNLERAQATPKFKPLDIRELLTSAVRGVEGLAASKNLRLSLSVNGELPPVAGDGQQMLQAFTNLLDNAIKFTPNNGQITVRALQESHQVIIEFEDNGIGIPSEDQAQVFDRFFRVERRRAVTDAGSGLGLSLVKAIIEQHHGTIDLRSAENRGTTFTVKLPLIQDPATATA